MAVQHPVHTHAITDSKTKILYGVFKSKGYPIRDHWHLTMNSISTFSPFCSPDLTVVHKAVEVN